MSKKSRIILATTLGIGAAIATAATVTVFTMKKKIDNNREQTKFQAALSLKSSGYDFLSFNIGNLNVEKFKDKEVQVLLIDKTTNTNIQVKSFKITKNIEEVLFENLAENKVYVVEVKYDSQTVESKSFSTKERPRISASQKTATSATILLTNLKDLPGSLDNVKIVIKNKSKPESDPIIVKASDLNLVNGNALFDLKNSNLGLEPNSDYSAHVVLNENGKDENLSEELEFKTAAATDVAYSFNPSENKLILYGLKENGKKVELEYRASGTQLAFKKLVSKENVASGSVSFTFTEDLGFDNTYEFKVKYENPADTSDSTDPVYLDFENKTKVATFTTQSAPTISVETENGLNIKLDKLNSSVNKDDLFIRYKDKENSNTWIEKSIKDIPGFESGDLTLPDLLSDTSYEAQLIYKKPNEDKTSTTSIILSEVEFKTNKNFTFDASKSVVGAKKALLSFLDNSKLAEASYANVSLKLSKVGSSELKTVNITRSTSNDKVFGKVMLNDLEPNSLYVWSLNEGDKALTSGTLKTGQESDVNKDSSNTNNYEDKETNFIAVDNRLTDGILVSVKNTFGYITNEDSNKYYPTEISIKYYLKESPTEVQTETLFVTLSDIKNKKIFTKQINELGEGTYTFEVSYKNGLDANNNEVLITKSFDVNYKYPEISFNNENNKLIITNLDALNNKNITIKYNDGSESTLSLTAPVTDNKVEVTLTDLRSDRTYDLKLEINSEDIEFKSSKQGETREQFYGNTSNGKVVLSSSFETATQKNTIWVKHERVNYFASTTDIYVILEGFKEYVNKSVKVVIGTEEQLNAENAYTNAELKSYTKTVDADGRVDGNSDLWLRGLTTGTDYKIRVLEVKENNTFDLIAERSYRTPDSKTIKLQNLEIVGSNTGNPGFKVENIQALRDLQPDKIFFRAQQLTDERQYRAFENVEPVTFTSGDKTFGHLKFTKSVDNLGGQNNIIRLFGFLTSDNSQFQSWFVNKSNYQIVLTAEKGGTEYIIATNAQNTPVLFNYDSPKFADNGFKNSLVQDSTESKNLKARVEFKLRDVTEYTQTGEDSPKLNAVYVKSDDPLASANPSIWHKVATVAAPAEDAEGISVVAFDNLEPNTYYNFAFVDTNNNLILSRDRVKTPEAPRLRNTTFGDTIMRYTLTGLVGTESFIPHATYVIKYGKNGEFNHESNEFVLDDSTNLSRDVVFTLQDGLEPNSTYNYKLVNKENGAVLLSFEDIFKTNKSQSEETVIGNNFAIVKLLNPSYELREASYSIAKRGTEADQGKTILDVLKMQYSTSADFSTYKEFSVSLSENEANLLAIKLQDLQPNTTYYYRLVKGTVKANVIKNSNNESEVVEPEAHFNEASPELSGSFTTLNTNLDILTTLNTATLSFNVPNVTEQNQVYLSTKRQDSTNIYDVKYEYKIVDGKVVFELDNLENSTIYEYSLTSVLDNSKLANGTFKTNKEESEITSKLITIDDAYRRLELTNLNDYVGKKIRIKHKQVSSATGAEKVLPNIETVLTNENDEFLWDFADLEPQNTHKIEVVLLDENNTEVKTIFAKEFLVSSKYTSGGDRTVTTNVRTLGNYELNKTYTVATLQELYASPEDWQQKVKYSLIEVAIFGTEVSKGSAYAWHKLIVPGTTHRYYRDDGQKLIYEYMFVDTYEQPAGKGKLKGLKFEFELLGNTIQVKILEAKVKPDLVDSKVVISEYKWSELTSDLVYGSANGIVNQDSKTVAGRYINISGFKFKAVTPKRGTRDFSIPQVFRYSVEMGSPALNKLRVSEYTAGSFIKLTNNKQEERYGDFNNSSEFNYDVAYEKYLSKENEILPFNANFLITPSSHPYLYANNQDIYAPAFRYDGQLREKFFRYLKENGKIRFTGADVSNKDWIFFNSKDIVMFDDATSVYSEKYLTEFPFVKLLIWRDGNQLKGLRLTLNDADGTNGAAMGMLDDYVYYLDYDKNINLDTLTWEKFTSLATKHTIHKYMNPNSPGTAIAGIGFVSKNKEFINNSTSTFINPQNTQFSAAIESESTGDSAQVRKIKLYNAEVGRYTLSIEYPIFYPTADRESYNETVAFDITEDNKNYFELDLSTYLQYNTEYKATLKIGERVIKELSGINANIPGGFTYFGSRNIKNVSAGEYYVNNNRNAKHLWDSWPPENKRRFSINSREVLGIDTPKSDQGIREFNERLKSILVGSTRLSTNGEMRYKWSFKVQPNEHQNLSTARQSLLAGVLTDDKSKIIIVDFVVQTYGNSSWFYTRYVREYTLQDDELERISELNLRDKFNAATNITDQILDSANITEESLKEGGENHGKVGFYGLFIKDKETPAAPSSN